MNAAPEPFERVVWYGCALLVAWALTLMAGCCTNAGSSATCARKVVTGMYTVEGTATALSRPILAKCDTDAVALSKAGDDAAATTALAKCADERAIVSKALNACVAATGAAASSIDAAESIAVKDYSSALAPLYAAGVQLAQALIVAGVKIPFPIPGVN